MGESRLLKDLLVFTRDGEWGKGKPDDDLVEMAVIRGTDFSSVRRGDVSSVPRRFIPKNAAARKSLAPGDLLIETAGGTKDQPTGRSVYLTERILDAFPVPVTCASFSRFLRVNQEFVNPMYLFWYLQLIYSTGEMLPYHVQHTGVARFQYTDFASKCWVPLPSQEEQAEIADTLSVLDRSIALNWRMNETLEAMARAIFKEWFVDFGPTRAKIEGRAPYLAPEVWDLFPESLGTEGHPIGWRRKNLGKLFNVSIGRTPPRKEQHHFVPSGQGRTWLSIKTMGSIQTFATASEEDLTPEAVALFRVPEVPAGTVLVSFKLTVGRVAIAAKHMHSNEAIAHLVSHHETPVGNVFAYCFMKDFDYGTLSSTSSIATAVNSKTIKDIEMIVPDELTHRAFVAIMQPIFDRILGNLRESEALSATRDLLLPRLMSGRIRLREAEKALQAVA